MVWIEANIVSWGKVSVSLEHGLWLLAVLKDSESELQCLFPNAFIKHKIGMDVHEVIELQKCKHGKSRVKEAVTSFYQTVRMMKGIFCLMIMEDDIPHLLAYDST